MTHFHLYLFTKKLNFSLDSEYRTQICDRSIPAAMKRLVNKLEKIEEWSGNRHLDSYISVAT